MNNADNVIILYTQTKKTADAFTHLQQKNMIKKTIIIKQRIPDNNIVCTDKKTADAFTHLQRIIII